MGKPAIRVLLKIFIGEHGLKGPSVQVQIKHISGSEGLWRHGREELLIDGPMAHHANGRGRGGGWMGRPNHPNKPALRGECKFRAIEKRTTGSCPRNPCPLGLL